jgi:hypothetical protein
MRWSSPWSAANEAVERAARARRETANFFMIISFT